MPTLLPFNNTDCLLFPDPSFLTRSNPCQCHKLRSTYRIPVEVLLPVIYLVMVVVVGVF